MNYLYIFLDYHLRNKLFPKTILFIIFYITWVNIVCGELIYPNIVKYDSENHIQLIDQAYILKSPNFNINSGGGKGNFNLSGAPRCLYSSFGHSFQTTGSAKDSREKGKDLYNRGAKFLEDQNIFKRGVLDDPTIEGKDTALLDANYDQIKLELAEKNFRSALYLDPFDSDSLLGIIKVRLAMAERNNLLADDLTRKLHCKRLTSTESGDSILREEIEFLDNISGENGTQRESIALLLDLFRDSQYRGPGALLRGEIKAADMTLANRVLIVLYNCGRRFVESELSIAEKKLLYDFFDETRNCKEILERLSASSQYIVDMLFLISAYTLESVRIQCDANLLLGLQKRMQILYYQINEGYNPFGFLPDFVPFASNGADDSNLSTFNSLIGIAEDATEQARLTETNVETENIVFEGNQADYAKNLSDLQATYAQRLQSLVGTVKIDGEEVPDVFTFLIPDQDLDNPLDNITERDERRLELTNSSIEFRGKGQIGQQWLIIKNAEKRCDVAFNDLNNNFNEIVIRETTAQSITGISSDISQLILSNGKKVGLLTREKGILQNEALQQIAVQQRRSSWCGRAQELGDKYLGEVKDPFFSGEKKLLKGGPAAAISSVCQGVDGMFNQYWTGRSILKIAAIQGQLEMDLANIDAKIQEIQAIERADIVMLENRKELKRTEQELKVLALKQANLSLNIEMCRRDLTREQEQLMNLQDEAARLISDYARASRLAENEGQFGWNDNDIRKVHTNDMLIAEAAFNRAQIWTFLALRALEYYANRPPQSNGQPDQILQGLYKQLYQARNANHCMSGSTDTPGGVIPNMKALAGTDFLFSAKDASCPQRGILSVKYDVIVPTEVKYEASEGSIVLNNVDNESTYRYYDSNDSILYEGAKAYQAAFRAALRNSLSTDYGTQIFKLVFSTDLFAREPANDTSTINGFNPFGADVVNAKIVGFQHSACAGTGVIPNVQGVRVNFVGTFVDINNAPEIEIYQKGNSYLKHTRFLLDRDPLTGRIKDPWKSISVYSAYEQLMPTGLLGIVNETGELISSSVGGIICPLLNQNAVGASLSTVSLDFTDRSVANDHWEIIIRDEGVSHVFFEKLVTALNNPMPQNPNEDFLTDIQLWIGWAHKGI